MLSYCMLTETNTLIISLKQITVHSGIFKYKNLSFTIVLPVRHTKLWHPRRNYTQKLQFKRRILTNNFNNFKIVFLRLQFCCITSVIPKLTVSGVRVDIKNCGDPSKKSGWCCFTKHLIDIGRTVCIYLLTISEPADNWRRISPTTATDDCLLVSIIKINC